MKYINTKYMLFDRIVGDLATANGGISFPSDNHGKDNYGYINISTEKKKMYFMFEHRGVGSDSWINTYALIVKLSNCDVCLYHNSDNKTMNLKCGSKTLATYAYSSSFTFTKFLLTVDTENGKIVVQFGSMKYEYDASSIIGCDFVEATIGIKYYSRDIYSVIKNIIISDEPIKMNEIIKEIPISVASSDWNKDGDSYLTDSSGKKITFSADTSDLETFNIKSASLFFESSQSSESISELKTNIGGVAGNLRLSDKGEISQGNCVNNPDLTKEISVES